MANYYGAARSNYVRVKDEVGLRLALAGFDIDIAPMGDTPTTVCFLSRGDGGWPSTAYVEDGDEIEFDPSVQILPYLEPDQVLIMMESGSEKLRYLVGAASAYHTDGRQLHMRLSDIYENAAKARSPRSLRPNTDMNDILNKTEVAALLDCEESTVEEKARTRELPGVKIGRSWIFPREALLQRLNALALEHVDKPAARAVLEPPKPARKRARPDLARLGRFAE